MLNILSHQYMKWLKLTAADNNWLKFNNISSFVLNCSNKKLYTHTDIWLLFNMATKNISHIQFRLIDWFFIESIKSISQFILLFCTISYQTQWSNSPKQTIFSYSPFNLSNSNLKKLQNSSKPTYTCIDVVLFIAVLETHCFKTK